jgi:hypothetical protein
MRVQAIGDAVVVTVGSNLLRRDVDDLARKLRLLGRMEVLVVDLSRARDLDDAFVAQLAEVLWGIAGRVEFRGLSLHQRRLLRYLGHPTPGRLSLRPAGDVVPVA